MRELIKRNDERIDELEAVMLDNFVRVECPLNHIFSPGMYVREIFMSKGDLITSAIHLTEHIFIVSAGEVSVYIEGVGWEHIKAPYTGRTMPGTRRILCIHEHTKWSTIHPLDFITGEEQEWEEEKKQELASKIKDMILEKHVNPLLTEKEKEAICQW